MQLVTIAWTVIAPIFFIIAAGYTVQRRIGLDVQMLTRVIFWILTPAFLFINIYESKLSGGEVLGIIGHFALLFCTMFTVSWYGAGLVGAQDRLRRAVTASVLFYNSGNYGIPVAQLAFGGAGLAVQSVVIVLQNITNFTIGIGLYAGGRAGTGRRHTLGAIFRLPMVYTLIIAWVWRASGVGLPQPLHDALGLLGRGLVPLALITLGAQMASLKSHRFNPPMLAALGLRLVGGPLLGGLLVVLMHIPPAVAPALIVSTSFPTAVNCALLAAEFDNEPDFAAATVFYSTVISALTVSLVIYVVKTIFPAMPTAAS